MTFQRKGIKMLCCLGGGSPFLNPAFEAGDDEGKYGGKLYLCLIYAVQQRRKAAKICGSR